MARVIYSVPSYAEYPEQYLDPRYWNGHTLGQGEIVLPTVCRPPLGVAKQVLAAVAAESGGCMPDMLP